MPFANLIAFSAVLAASLGSVLSIVLSSSETTFCTTLRHHSSLICLLFVRKTQDRAFLEIKHKSDLLKYPLRLNLPSLSLKTLHHLPYATYGMLRPAVW
jgi:hypothetical protein